MRRRPLRVVAVGGPLLMVALVTAVCGAVDWAVGVWDGTAAIRAQARAFRGEAALLRLPTTNLLPDLDDDVAARAAGGASRRVRTDGAGVLRGPDDAPGAATTILFLGGSTTECHEVDEAARFPAAVERTLRARGLDVATLNGGVRGHTSQDSINALLNRPGFRRAAVVVLEHNVNDRVRLARHGDYAARLGVEAPTTATAVAAAAARLGRAGWDWLSYRSNVLFRVRFAFGNANPLTGFAPADVLDAGAIDLPWTAAQLAAFEQNLGVFVAVARALHQTPVLMTQPLGVDSPAQDAFNDGVRRVAAASQAVLIDLARELRGTRPAGFQPDAIHLDEHGSLAVARIVADHLGRLLAAPGG